MQIHYPVLETKLAAKDFKATCHHVVKRKEKYIKTGKGRYCMACKKLAEQTNSHKEKVVS